MIPECKLKMGFCPRPSCGRAIENFTSGNQKFLTW